MYMLEVDTASIAANKLIEVIKLSRSSEKFNLFLSGLERNEMGKACIDVKSLIDWNFNFGVFYNAFSQYQYPPLEFLWNLQILQIMLLETYLLKIGTQLPTLQKFKESISALCFEKYKENDVSYFLLSGIFSYLVNKAHPPATAEDDEKIKEISGSIVKGVMQDIFSADETELQDKRLYPFFALWNSGILEEASLHDFSHSCLSNFLELQPTTEVAEAFLVLENCKNKHAPFHLFSVIEKFIRDLHNDEMKQILNNAVKKNTTNWKSYLVTVNVFMTSNKEGYNILSQMVTELTKEAYETFDQSLLCKAFLIGRQITLKTDVFFHICYRQWYQAYVANSSWLKTPKSVSMLIQVLSDLVPFESDANCLKVILEVPLCVPLRCQTEYTDYIALLKTRIQDLKPEPKHVQTMEKVLSYFEETNKIPPMILEASIIQKHKFLNEFLPALLVPRVVPRIPDVKEKFIEALNRAGKIPSNILLKYKQACHQEEGNILAGINMAEDNFNKCLGEDIT